MSKLKGSRLEAEVDRARTDGNWKKLTELLPAINSKHSGIEDSYELLQAEIQLETFLEQQEVLRPHKEHYDKLKAAESLLTSALKESNKNGSSNLEGNLLMSKLQYISTEYRKALTNIEESGMENANTPFRTLRALRLAAEGYAIKGLCLEAIEGSLRPHAGSVGSNTSYDQKPLFCFEKSAELTISYINELEKTIFSSQKSTNPASGSFTNTLVAKPTEKIGEILECCLERVAVLRAKDTIAQKKNGSEGIEWYRRIITCLGDKSTGERLQQKLSRQLAELLIRAAVPNDRAISEALSMKSQNLSFYTGSQRAYFSPSSRIEEIILLLLISEVLATREVVLSRSEELTVSRVHSIRNIKSVYNLLTVVLSTLRQHNLLSAIYERAMKFVNQDTFLWEQFALSLLCRGKWNRAARVLEEAVAAEDTNNTILVDSSCAVEHMLLAQVYMERTSKCEAAIEHATKALTICEKNGQQAFLIPRCRLLQAIALGQKAQRLCSWDERRRKMLGDTLTMFEAVVLADPHDYLALYYAALYHAIARDLESARERCARSLELNNEQPAAIMLLALMFTSYGDLKGALELVVNALRNFPNNYGLFVLRLHIETKFGRIEESLDTCSHLLDFWKKREASFGPLDEDRSQMTIGAAEGALLREGSTKTGTPSLGREMMPGTPMISSAQMIGFSGTVLEANASQASVIDLSVAESGIPGSEYGGQSTASDSAGSSSGNSETWSKFKAQADIWMSLAELYLAEGKLTDVGRCVEQAVTLFPHSPQAMYLKGRLLNCRAEKMEDETVALKLGAEAKAAYLSALALSPSHTPTLLHLARLYTAEGNLMMAEHVYRELVRIEPLSCEWWQQLGCLLMRQGQVDPATECLTKASQLDRWTPLLPFTVIPIVFPTSF